MMNAGYDYQVQTFGGSSWDNLENVGDHLQQTLLGEETASLTAQGWELWQVNTLQNSAMNGLIFIFRRPKA